MPLKGLTPEQLFDSLAEATGYRDAPGMQPPGSRFGYDGAARSSWRKFANASDKRTEYQTSILQALALMNGKFVADATSLERSETLAAVLDAPVPGHRAAARDAVPGHAGPAERDRTRQRDWCPTSTSGGPSGDPKQGAWPTSSGPCSTAANSF